MTDQPSRHDERSSGRIVRTATEARGGEIILGKYGRWIWAVTFVLLVILFVSLAFWW